MFIEKLVVKNYKKLKFVNICLSEKQNLFIGPNNSGKTSAIEVLSKFLTDQKSFSIYDVTVDNWHNLNCLFNRYYTNSVDQKDLETLDSLYKKMMELLPTMKVIASVEKEELYHVKPLIPYLHTDCKKVAVTYTYEPSNFEELLVDYKKFNQSIESWREKTLTTLEGDTENLDEIIDDHWPKDFKSFLASESRFKKYFTTKYYVSNPDKEDGDVYDSSTKLHYNPLKNIVKVSIIGAQRGLMDSNEDGDTVEGSKISLNNTKKLSKLFSSYYSEYLNPINQYSEKDYSILSAVTNSKKIFQEHLQQSIKPIQKKMGDLGYPGFGSPSIAVRPQINLTDSLKGEASILLNTHKGGIEDEQYYLPEHNNGLGYQNLIAMFFKLNIFKEERLAYGGSQEKIIEPLHLVLIEEPEAHLHAQAQKVFIDKAYELVSISKEEKNVDAPLKTQLLISTHSSHITHKAEIDELVYFSRQISNDIFSTDVISLKNCNLDPDTELDAEGKQIKGLNNKKFVQKYLQLSEHDLFFADGVILIEGVSERILLPELIRNNVESLTNRYITILEVGGAYANRLLEFLKIINRPTLIITDIDSVTMSGKKQAIDLDGDLEMKSSNSTINKWFEKSKEERREHKRYGKNISNSIVDDKLISQLITKNEVDKIKGEIRIAYQYEKYGDSAYARTFEDAIALTNFEWFKELKTDNNNFSKLVESIPEIFSDVAEIKSLNKNHSQLLFEAINTKNVKSEFALDLLFIQEDNLKCPTYILEGLEWLDKELSMEPIIEPVMLEEEIHETIQQ